jgi:hypothetical protein
MGTGRRPSTSAADEAGWLQRQRREQAADDCNGNFKVNGNCSRGRRGRTRTYADNCNGKVKVSGNRG